MSWNQVSAREQGAFTLDIAITTDTAQHHSATWDTVWYYHGTKDTLFYWLHIDGYLVKHKSFHPKNRIHNDVNFKNGYIHGELIQYYKNGQVYRKTCFKNGKILCGMRVYNKKGRLKYLYITQATLRDKFYTKYKYNRAGEEVKSEKVEVYPPFYSVFPEYFQSGPLNGKEGG
ncbi:MAG: hypothetical protein OEW75_18755, partial [Cyclobacteriaceae bacterium]|nr:hypothetical protein [Cyclobacteriaceae bacterium]